MKTGFIVKRQNIDSISLALNKLILDKGLRNEFGKNGINRVKELYDWEKNVEVMNSLYLESL